MGHASSTLQYGHTVRIYYPWKRYPFYQETFNLGGMPRLDGRETFPRLRQAGNWTPVILPIQVGSPAKRAMALDQGMLLAAWEAQPARKIEATGRQSSNPHRACARWIASGLTTVSGRRPSRTSAAVWQAKR